MEILKYTCLKTVLEHSTSVTYHKTLNRLFDANVIVWSLLDISSWNGLLNGPTQHRPRGPWTLETPLKALGSPDVVKESLCFFPLVFQ